MSEIDTRRRESEDQADYEMRIHRTFAALALAQIMADNDIDPQSEAGKRLAELAEAQMRKLVH